LDRIWLTGGMLTSRAMSLNLIFDAGRAFNKSILRKLLIISALIPCGKWIRLDLPLRLMAGP